MERSMQATSLDELTWTEVNQKQIRVKNMITYYSSFRWVGHVTEFMDNKWSCEVVGMYPSDRKLPFYISQ